MRNLRFPIPAGTIMAEEPLSIIMRKPERLMHEKMKSVSYVTSLRQIHMLHGPYVPVFIQKYPCTADISIGMVIFHGIQGKIRGLVLKADSPNPFF